MDTPNSTQSLIWKHLMNPDTLIVFDADGVLFSYNYGSYRSHHDLDDGYGHGNKFRSINLYKNAKCIPVIREYILTRDIETIYVLSKEVNGFEQQKTDALQAHYGILPDHCMYVKEGADKVDRLLALFNEKRKNLIYIDDNEKELRGIEMQTPFPTAHVTVFFEDGAIENIRGKIK